MPISPQFIQELQDKLDIETVIGAQVDLKRRGKTLVGLCPFHNEKTPSFTVYPDTRSFYCFGCGAGGDIITFVRRMENLDYVEAVRTLAQQAGLPMPEDGYDDSLFRQRQRLLAANRAAARFFNAQLNAPEHRAALDYFLRRGLTPNTIRHFGLGYAPDDWRQLTDHLKAQGFTAQELVLANLARRSDKNGRTSYYDNFRNRVMFPIIDLQGNVIAFGGRVMDDSKPKYINTADTPVYKKSNGVFALNFAKNSNENRLILVEGYMDVIALHQAGFTNAIACLGTAFTSEQANLLSRYADEILICYDNDEAGRKATRRALEVLGRTGLKLLVVQMEGGKDADEIIRTHGRERFADLIRGAANRTEYRLLRERENHNLLTDDGKLRFLTAAAAILADCGEIEQELYAARLSNEFGVSVESIKAQIRSARGRLRRQEEKEKKQKQMELMTRSAEDQNNPERKTHLRQARAEETLLASFFRNPDFYHKLKETITPADFVTHFNRRMMQALCEMLDAGLSPELSLFAQAFDPEEMATVTRICRSAETLHNSLRECEDCIAVLKEAQAQTAPQAVAQMSDEEYRKQFEALKGRKQTS